MEEVIVPVSLLLDCAHLLQQLARLPDVAQAIETRLELPGLTARTCEQLHEAIRGE